MPEELDYNALPANQYPRASFWALLNKYGDKEFNCVEVGVDEGINAERMIKTSPKSHFTLVDPFVPYRETLISQEELTARKNTMLKRIGQFNGRTKFLEMPSKEAAALFPDKTFDYIYIDGCHLYNEVTEDIIAWWPKLKCYGIMGGHDYVLQTVEKAVINHFIPMGLYVWGITLRTNEQNIKTSLPNCYIECMDWWVNKERILNLDREEKGGR